MKKHLAIFTAILTLMLTMVGTVPTLVAAESTYANGQEILENGDFEMTNDDAVGTEGKFIGGSWANGTQKTSTNIQIVDEAGGAYQGKSAKVVTVNPESSVASLVSPTANLATFYENEFPLEGATTKLSFRINVERLDSATDSFIYICIGNGGNYLPNNTSASVKNRKLGEGKKITGVTDGWVDMELRYPAKNSAVTSNKTYYYLTFQVYGGATVYIDDVSVKEVKDGLLYSTEWDNVALPNVETWTVTEKTDTKIFGSASHLITHPGTATQAYAVYALEGRSLLTAGEKYKLAFWYKPVNPEDTSNPFVTIAQGTSKAPSRLKNSRFIDFRRDQWLAGGEKDGWREYVVYFTMESYDSSNTVLGLMFLGTNSFYIDNFTVTEDTDTDIAFYNAAGETVTAVKANDVLKAKAHLLSDKNETEGGRTVQILVARYEKNGDTLQCVEVSCENKTVYDEKQWLNGEDVARISGAEDVTLSYTVPSDAPAGSVIKAFLWDGVGTLKPIGAGMEKITVAAE